MKKIIIAALICLLSVTALAEVRECPKHGILDEDDNVTITFWGEEYHLCGKCILELISNNSDEIGKIIKKAKEVK